MAEVAALCKDCPIDDMVGQIAAALPGAKVMAIQQVVKSRMEMLAQRINPITPEGKSDTLSDLERIGTSFSGVSSCYAIQAGREIRIIARPEDVADDAMALLAREISQKIESELEYPGQIKVSVIRETRTVDYAK